MPTKTSRALLVLSEDESRLLEELVVSRTASVREVERAKILLAYSRREPLTSIARSVGVARDTVYKCVDKALAMGVAAGLRDLFHRPKEAVILDDAKAWVVHIACTKPKDLGYASELWTRRQLAEHVRRHADEAGFPALNRAVKATVQRILSERSLRPEKIRYYLEKRDPEFERKMREVLLSAVSEKRTSFERFGHRNMHRLKKTRLELRLGGAWLGKIRISTSQCSC